MDIFWMSFGYFIGFLTALVLPTYAHRKIRVFVGGKVKRLFDDRESKPPVS